jgi:hypothetical protein
VPAPGREQGGAGKEGIIPPRRFQNPYIKCVGPGIKDPEAGGEPKESQISAKPRSVGLIYTGSKWPSVFFYIKFYFKSCDTNGKLDFKKILKASGLFKKQNT